MEGGVSDAFHILPYILSAPLISAMDRTNSSLWAGAHFLLTASHFEHKLCVFYFLPRASPMQWSRVAMGLLLCMHAWETHQMEGADFLSYYVEGCLLECMVGLWYE